jgi:hypothetical protein
MERGGKNERLQDQQSFLHTQKLSQIGQRALSEWHYKLVWGSVFVFGNLLENKGNGKI